MLKAKESELLEIAERALERAFAPYSGFRVGAAVLGGSGKVYSGCNVEVSSYGLTLCAERVALFKAISEGETMIHAVAVVSSSEGACPPCGACRQAIHDFGKDAAIIVKGRDGRVLRFDLRELFPAPFGRERLT